MSNSNNEKGNTGIKGKFTRAESDVFSDAVADFPDSGVKDHFLLQTLSGSSEFNDFEGKKIVFFFTSQTLFI